jgi:hypothetical protein
MRCAGQSGNSVLCEARHDRSVERRHTTRSIPATQIVSKAHACTVAQGRVWQLEEGIGCSSGTYFRRPSMCFAATHVSHRKRDGSSTTADQSSLPLFLADAPFLLRRQCTLNNVVTRLPSAHPQTHATALSMSLLSPLSCCAYWRLVCCHRHVTTQYRGAKSGLQELCTSRQT